MVYEINLGRKKKTRSWKAWHLEIKYVNTQKSIHSKLQDKLKT